MDTPDPPYAPITLASDPLCVEPKRTLPVSDCVDDGPIAYPDTIEHTPTTQVRRKL